MKSFLHGEAAILMGIVTWAGRLKRTDMLSPVLS